MLDKHPALSPLHDFETSLWDNWQPHGQGKILAGSSDPLHLNIASPELYILCYCIAKVNLREQVLFSNALICVSPYFLLKHRIYSVSPNLPLWSMRSIYRSNKVIPSGLLLMHVCTPTHIVASSLACIGTSFFIF